MTRDDIITRLSAMREAAYWRWPIPAPFDGLETTIYHDAVTGDWYLAVYLDDTLCTLWRYQRNPAVAAIDSLHQIALPDTGSAVPIDRNGWDPLD